MVRPEVIRRRIEAVSENLEVLERLARYDEDEFLADPEHYGSAERFLQLALEALLDMGSHVIADNGLGSVNQGRDIPRLFREHGYIDSALEEKWLRMIGFRNILVHAYLQLDRRQVYQVLCNDLADIRALQRTFASFL
ncbi:MULTISPECIES: type VII toxin-antitoxin system HepT family RNase toxin [Thioalkalivibrio]|uniref:DUF86 domain-containing protein n=1 Tax=Thioalkalivibrio halophilus TaxID=252474 RepID=A0A1V2ZX25_9GAMM|nr:MULTISPECIES: DUF86 domain-containing protein [Thioalkalivibrio]OOC09678.1 hypothetical protein B1A74_09795 [Thioalkalivibrio halophilus]PYG04321.1 uncharacterized protein YutE (UPF0331/DUF86 family) [Thioalkalivibrio sp. ALE21]